MYGLQQQVDSEEWRNQTRASLRPRFEKQLYGGDVVAQVLVKHTKDLTVVSRCQKCNRSRSFTFDERHTTKTECNFTNLYRVDVGVFVDETMVAAKLWNDAIGDQVLVTVVYVVSIRFHQSVSAETKKLGSEIYSNYKNQLYFKMASKQV